MSEERDVVAIDHHAPTLEEVLLSRLNTYIRYFNQRKLFEAGICPFCQIDPDVNEVLYENKHFVIWEVPQDLSRDDLVLAHHILIVSKKHYLTLEGKSKVFWASLGDMIDWAHEHYDLPGGMIAVRFGSVMHSSASERHIHFNLKVPNLKGFVGETIAKDPKKFQSDLTRGRHFAQCYERGWTPEEYQKAIDAGIDEGKYPSGLR